MLSYLALYLLAAVLLFQGVHALGEQSAPMGVVPAEVKLSGAQATLWGGFLAALGAIMILTGLLSHFIPWLTSAVGPLRILGFLALAAYGLWLVFSRKINYTPAPSTTTASSHH